MFTITINAKTPDEFKEAVKGLNALFPDASKKGKAEMKAETKAPAQEVTAVAPAADPAPGAEAPAQTIKITDVREAVQAAVQEKKQPKLKALFAEFNATGVTTLDPWHYAEFLTKLKAAD
jgi:hypothetical protein